MPIATYDGLRLKALHNKICVNIMTAGTVLKKCRERSADGSFWTPSSLWASNHWKVCFHIIISMKPFVVLRKENNIFRFILEKIFIGFFHRKFTYKYEQKWRFKLNFIQYRNNGFLSLETFLIGDRKIYQGTVREKSSADISREKVPCTFGDRLTV